MLKSLKVVENILFRTRSKRQEFKEVLDRIFIASIVANEDFASGRNFAAISLG